MAEDDFLESLGVHETPEQMKNCWSAIKAAAEAIGDYCGVEITMPDTEGVTISAPQEIVDIANSDLPREERIIAIADSEWCKDTASTMCQKLLGVEPGTTKHDECVETAAARLAEEVISAEE